MVAFKLLLVAASSSLVAAWPEPTPIARLEGRYVDCNNVNGALSILKKLGPPATTFCSSYLNIPATKTSTTTFTPVAITIATSTTTVTSTQAFCANPKFIKGSRDFIYARPADAVEEIEKRTDVPDVLPLLAAFAAAKVSAGCSCLNLQPRATTTTTATASTPTIKVVATETKCVPEQ